MRCVPIFEVCCDKEARLYLLRVVSPGSISLGGPSQRPRRLLPSSVSRYSVCPPDLWRPLVYRRRQRIAELCVYWRAWEAAAQARFPTKTSVSAPTSVLKNPHLLPHIRPYLLSVRPLLRKYRLSSRLYRSPASSEFIDGIDVIQFLI